MSIMRVSRPAELPHRRRVEGAACSESHVRAFPRIGRFSTTKSMMYLHVVN